ncbi:MAG TPA: hypothetical protein VNI60_00150 [Pyrinomonadaceae bacterium]|nr:hypothetical protein [Pyrinomonadaceae bacterium]
MKTNLVKGDKKKKSDEREVIFEEFPETGEVEIQTSATEDSPAKSVRFPQEITELRWSSFSAHKTLFAPHFNFQLFLKLQRALVT